MIWFLIQILRLLILGLLITSNSKIKLKNINKISFSIITIVGFFSCESTKNDNIYDDQAFKSLTAEVISNGVTIYNKNCSSCHANGIAGAPNMDDNQHWNKVAEKGYKNIFENVKKGFYGERGIMPPKGNCLDCLDTELQASILFMFHTIKDNQKR